MSDNRHRGRKRRTNPALSRSLPLLRSVTRSNGTTSSSTAISPSPFPSCFFPLPTRQPRCLLAFGTFGVSYLVRPLGALVLGAYADRAGRRAAMLLSIVVMTIGTGLMAIMPTYGTVGIVSAHRCAYCAASAGLRSCRRIR